MMIDAFNDERDNATKRFEIMENANSKSITRCIVESNDGDGGWQEFLTFDIAESLQPNVWRHAAEQSRGNKSPMRITMQDVGERNVEKITADIAADNIDAYIAEENELREFLNVNW